MSVTELDPVFLKAIHLLRSNSSESVDTLKFLLTESIKKSSKYPKGHAKFDKLTSNLGIIPIKSDDGLSRDYERKIKEEFDGHKYTKPKNEVFLAGKTQLIKEEPEDIEMTRADDIALEIMEGLMCIVCRGLDVAPGNQLIECQDCHNLYHQECHNPPVADEDAIDPRHIWCCSKCQNDAKKIHLQNLNRLSSKSSSSSLAGSKFSSSSGKTDLPKPNTLKTTNMFSSLSNPSAKSSKGLHTQSSSKSSSSSISNPLMSADKRLQMMKRKAAAKMQEKKSIKFIK